MAIHTRKLTSQSRNHRLFAGDFFGTPITTTVTATPSVVRKWLSATLYACRFHCHHLIISLGVQWLPGGSDQPAATVQLCIGRRCLIFQLCNADYVPRRLRRVLADPDITFVGIWNQNDAEKLLKSKHKLSMSKRPIDLRYYVETENGESLRKESIETIVREVLGFEGVRVERSISTSDWEAEVLQVSQIQQACVDSYVSFMIGKELDAYKFSR